MQANINQPALWWFQRMRHHNRMAREVRTCAAKCGPGFGGLAETDHELIMRRARRCCRAMFIQIGNLNLV